MQRYFFVPLYSTQKGCGAGPSAAACHWELYQLIAVEDLAHDFVHITHHIDQSFY